MLTLHDTPGSGNGYKARLSLALLGLALARSNAILPHPAEVAA